MTVEKAAMGQSDSATLNPQSWDHDTVSPLSYTRWTRLLLGPSKRASRGYMV